MTGWQGWVVTAGWCVILINTTWLSITRRHALMRVAHLEKVLKGGGPFADVRTAEGQDRLRDMVLHAPEVAARPSRG